MTADGDATVATPEHVAQQPGFILDPARTPPRVVAADMLGRLEQLLTHDAGHLDGNPLLACAQHLPGSASSAGVGYGFGAVVIGAPEIALIPQHTADSRGTPHCFASGRRHLVEVEAAHDLARGMAGRVILEDATDHRRFRFVRDQVRRGCWDSSNPAITVGHLPEDDLAAAR